MLGVNGPQLAASTLLPHGCIMATLRSWQPTEFRFFRDSAGNTQDTQCMSTISIRDPIDGMIRFIAGSQPRLVAGQAWCSAVTNGEDVEIMADRSQVVRIDPEPFVLETAPPSEVVHDGQGEVTIDGTCDRLCLRLTSSGSLEVVVTGSYLEVHLNGPGCIDLSTSRFARIAAHLQGGGEILAGHGQVIEYI